MSYCPTLGKLLSKVAAQNKFRQSTILEGAKFSGEAAVCEMSDVRHSDTMRIKSLQLESQEIISNVAASSTSEPAPVAESNRRVSDTNFGEREQRKGENEERSGTSLDHEKGEADTKAPQVLEKSVKRISNE